MNVMDRILQEVEHLPPFSHTALRLVQMASSDSHSMSEVAKLIESDTSLTANILKVANSAAFRRKNPVDTVATAVSMIGEKNVIGIALKFCSSGVYDKPLEGYACPAGGLWDYSLCSAIASRSAAAYSKVPVEPALAYTAGLLHDLGKIVISTFLSDEAAQLRDILDSEEDISFFEAERRVLGVDHCQVGSMVAEHWKLPQQLIAPMQFHHCPDDAEPDDRPLVYCVHVGDIVAMMGSNAELMDSMCYGLSENYDKYMRLEAGDLEHLIFAMQNEFQVLTESLNSKESK